MGIFNFGKGNSGGLMNVIRCDEQEYLVWKWRPAGQEANSTSRENAIRYNSSLRVKDGEVAVFVYNQKNGPSQDYIEGPFDAMLKTANMPVLSSIVGLAFGGDSPFQAEVYFINLAGNNQVKFTIPYFDVQDPRFPDLPVPVAVGGTLTFRLEDYKAFIKLNRLINFTLEDFKKQIKDAVTRRIKGTISNALLGSNIPLVQIERHIDAISDILRDKLKADMEDFGVTLRRLDINRIEPDKDDDNWERLQKVTGRFSVESVATNQDIAIDTARAQSDVNIHNLEDMQRINAANMEESLRVQREEGQYAQHLQTQTQNLGAYAIGQQAQVLGKAAESLGQMGTMNIGGAGGGFNPAAMMTGMAIGGAVGKQMNSMMGDMNGTAATPPPIPGMAPSMPFYVALGGQQSGPYDGMTLQTLVTQGMLTPQTMVWRQGMAAWTAAAQVPELAALFMTAAPPPIPGAGVPPVPGMPPMPGNV